MYVEVFLVGLLGAISPGPDFVVVMKNSLGAGRKHGIATALGIACALVAHVAYTVLGFSLLLQQSPGLYNAVRFAGAVYLLWLGWNAIRSRARTDETGSGSPGQALPSDRSTLQAFREGFLCNLLNPKAALFFLGIFSQFIGPGTAPWVRWIYGGEIILAVGLWFTFLAAFISNKTFRAFYRRHMHWFDRVLGAALIVLAAIIGYEIVAQVIPMS